MLPFTTTNYTAFKYVKRHPEVQKRKEYKCDINFLYLKWKKGRT